MALLAWQDVPWSLWAYVVLTTGAMVITVFVAPIQAGIAAFAIVCVLIWNFFLLRGVRWLWIASLVLGAFSLLLDLATGSDTWHGSLIGLIGLVLLALAPTHQFFSART